MSRPDAIRHAGRAMGSPLRLTSVGLARPAADRAWEVVVSDVEETERSLSRWRAGSGLSRLNATAGGVASMPVDARLSTMLLLAARAQRVSLGRFDPRVVARLEALGERAGVPLPDAPERLGSADRWLWSDPRAGVARISTAVDSGGIGKGLALRWAARALDAAGLSGTGFLVEAGGDLVTRGQPPQGGAWHVGIEDPAGGAEPLAVIAIGSGGVATSSIAVRRWTSPAGEPVHHLIDPATRKPGGAGLWAVTVAGPDPAWSEVWSKVLFLEGSRLIGDAARRRGLAAWWVESDGTLHQTPAASQQTVWTAAQRAA